VKSAGGRSIKQPRADRGSMPRPPPDEALLIGLPSDGANHTSTGEGGKCLDDNCITTTKPGLQRHTFASANGVAAGSARNMIEQLLPDNGVPEDTERRAHRVFLGYYIDLGILCVALSLLPFGVYHAAQLWCMCRHTEVVITGDRAFNSSADASNDPDSWLNQTQFNNDRLHGCFDLSSPAQVLDDFLAAAPVYLRGAMLIPILEKAIGYITGYQRAELSIWAQIILGGGKSDGTATAAGWLAIVGTSIKMKNAQRGTYTTWHAARVDRMLNIHQATSSSIAKLFLWHWCQPVAFMLVFCINFCELSPQNQYFGAVVAAREVMYMLGTILAAGTCPAFLLLDLFTVYAEAENIAEKWTRILAYTLTPHNYVMLCLSNRHPRYSHLFITTAFFLVLADFASCGALYLMLLQRIIDGIEFENTAMLIAYCITAVGFVLFWGPLSVMTSFNSGRDAGTQWAKWTAYGSSGVLSAGLVYVLIGYVLLLVRAEALCSAFIPGIKTGCHGIPVLSYQTNGGSCHRGACDCATSYRSGGNCSKFVPVTLGCHSQPRLVMDCELPVSHASSVFSVQFCRDSTCLVSSGEDGYVKLWSQGGNVLSWDETANINVGYKVFSMAFSSQGNLLAVGGQGGTQIYDFHLPLRDENEYSTAPKISLPTQPIRSISFSSALAEKDWFAAGSVEDEDVPGTSVTVWSPTHNYSNWNRIARLKGHTRTVMSLSFSPLGGLLASASLDGTVRLWAAVGGNWSHITKHTVYSGFQVFTVAFSPDGSLLAAGFSDNVIRIWSQRGAAFESGAGNSAKDWTLVTELHGHMDLVTSLSFSADGHWIASASFDHSVKIWARSDPQSQSWNEIQTDIGHSNYVYSVDISPSGATMVSGSIDTTVMVWS
jgi:WD40 repeat protein